MRDGSVPCVWIRAVGDTYQRGLEAQFEEKSLDFDAQLGVDRILPPKDVSEHQTNWQWLWAPD
jgi:hypothetical protein